MFKVGDVVTCAINYSIIRYVENGVYIRGIEDDIKNINVKCDYNVLEIDCEKDITVLETIIKQSSLSYLLSSLNYPKLIRLKEFPNKVYMSKRFKLNVRETRKKKIEDILR
jgi:hypothetical protein